MAKEQGEPNWPCWHLSWGMSLYISAISAHFNWSAFSFLSYVVPVHRRPRLFMTRLYCIHWGVLCRMPFDSEFWMIVEDHTLDQILLKSATSHHVVPFTLSFCTEHPIFNYRFSPIRTFWQTMINYMCRIREEECRACCDIRNQIEAYSVQQLS
jgi:hypothetical protein